MDDIIKGNERKDKIAATLELFKKDNTDFITEFPDAKHVKKAVMLSTWVNTVAENSNLTEDEKDVLLKKMLDDFKLAMISFRRKNVQYFVNALRGEEYGLPVVSQQGGFLRRMMGIR